MRRLSILVCMFMLMGVIIGINHSQAHAAARDFSYYTNDDGTLTIDGYGASGFSRKVKIPKKIKGKKVTRIAERTFYLNTRIKSLIIPEGILEIEDWSFASMPNLRKISFPQSVRSMSKLCGIGYYSEASEAPVITISCVKGSKAFRICRKSFSHQKLKVRKSKKGPLYFKPNGGKCSTVFKLVKKKGKYGKLPKAKRAGYKFLGWYTKKSGGKRVKAKTKYKKKTLYAHWKLTNPVATLKAPSYYSGGSTWDCIYFGSYYQKNMTAREKIKWRVLSIKGKEALLVSDSALDARRYSEKSNYGITWKNCTLRSWLNGYGANQNIDQIDYSRNSFINTAFTEAQRAMIKNTTLENKSMATLVPELKTSPYVQVGTWAGDGENTTDKIFLLSYKDIKNRKYGFHSIDNEDIVELLRSDDDVNRKLSATAYAKSKMGQVKNTCWYIRNMSASSMAAGIYTNDGMVKRLADISGSPSYIRPALKVNLSNTKQWSLAGTVKAK